MTRHAARVLAVDLGDSRIGLALSDELGLIAQPLETLTARGARKDLDAIGERVARHEVGTVVVGLPVHLSGKEGERAERARRWARRLAGRLPGVRVVLQDERLTTAQAERAMIDAGLSRDRRRRSVDAAAAALILEAWLESHRAGEHGP